MEGEERGNKVKFSFGRLKTLVNFATPFATYGFRKRKTSRGELKIELLEYFIKGSSQEEKPEVR